MGKQEKTVGEKKNASTRKHFQGEEITLLYKKYFSKYVTTVA